jgi:metal-responsive CopG/Arc/MetJ family transcriptional regulator
MAPDSPARGERLQIMLTEDELTALDDWRFKKQMPSRAAAVRELLRRGLASEGFLQADRGTKSKNFGVLNDEGGNHGGSRMDGGSDGQE